MRIEARGGPISTSGRDIDDAPSSSAGISTPIFGTFADPTCKRESGGQADFAVVNDGPFSRTGLWGRRSLSGSSGDRQGRNCLRLCEETTTGFSWRTHSIYML